MKRVLLFCGLLLVMPEEVSAQDNQNSFITPEQAHFRLDFSLLQCSLGPRFSRLESQMPDASSYLLATNTPVMSGFPLEVQAIFHDRIGIEAGMEVLSGHLDEYRIRDEFQQYVPDHTIEIPQMQRHMSNYDFRFARTGVLWYQSLGNLQLIPYADYLYAFKTWYPKLEVEMTHRSTNAVSTRTYLFESTKSSGLKVGAALRTYFKPAGVDRFKHTALYMQLRAELTYLRISGSGYYRDSQQNQSESVSLPSPFKQQIYTFLLGVTIGGLDFHW